MQEDSMPKVTASCHQDAPSPGPHLSPKEAAELLGVSVDTLAKWRADRTGPDYIGHTKQVLYPKAGLANYLRRIGQVPGDVRLTIVKWAAPEALAPLATKAQILRGAAPVPPILCGIYFLIADGEVVYVGQSVNLLSRILQHSRDGLHKYDSFSFVETKSEHLDAREKQYIAALLPRDNACSFTQRLREVARFSAAKSD